jgi:serine/threonine-protein kinase
VRYELTQLQSENSLFQTFTAFDKLQSCEVSVRLVKAPYSKEAELVETLQDVVRRVGAVRHPAIEEYYEVDTDEDAVFIVGQITKGSSISERLRKLATFSVPAAIEVAVALCEGLRALHRATLAHGDISGSNVAMQPDGETRLQNAGLWQAFYVDPHGREAMLMAGAAYTAPEVSKGGLPTPGSDMYGLGVLLYELLTGRPPYHGDSALALALMHATEPVPSAKQVNPSIPQALDQMLKKAMAKQPTERYRDGEEMLSDLRMLQDALRFGKSLSWPLKAEDPVSAVTTGADPKATAKAGEASPKSPRPVKLKEPKIEHDAALPSWLKIISVFVLGAVIAIAILFFMVNYKKPAMVKVPRLAYTNFSKASDVLTKLGLHLVKSRTITSEKDPADTILTTNPAPGALVYQGDDVKAVVSGGSQYVEVPDLRGMTTDKAKSTLEAAGLVLDDRTEEVSDRELAEGLIVSQTQQSGEKFERGSRIHVKISSGKSRAPASSDREANTKYVYNLNITIQHEQQPVQLRVDMTDDRGTKTVYDAKQNPDDVVPVVAEGYGSKATFRIFYDGQLVKQKVVSADNADDGSDSGDNTDNSDQQN